MEEEEEGGRVNLGAFFSILCSLLLNKRLKRVASFLRLEVRAATTWRRLEVWRKENPRRVFLRCWRLGPRRG
jgi:hypothetical protein